MKVGIVGSRNCGTLQMKDVLIHLPKECQIIASGSAKGVDLLAKQAASFLGIHYREFLPQYEKYGKHAPLLRNEQLVAYADVLLVFWDFRSKGTANAIVQAIRQSVPVFLYAIPVAQHPSSAKPHTERLNAAAQRPEEQNSLAAHMGD